MNDDVHSTPSTYIQYLGTIVALYTMFHGNSKLAQFTVPRQTW